MAGSRRPWVRSPVRARVGLVPVVHELGDDGGEGVSLPPHVGESVPHLRGDPEVHLLGLPLGLGLALGLGDAFSVSQALISGSPPLVFSAWYLFGKDNVAAYYKGLELRARAGHASVGDA